MAGQDSRNYRDDNGHRTHMAGIIAARMNRLGVVSTAYQAQIVAVKVLDQDGNGRLSDLINGLGWISTNKIRVVNMSLSFSEDSPLLKQAIQRLYKAGMIMVASAGNEMVSPKMAAATMAAEMRAARPPKRLSTTQLATLG